MQARISREGVLVVEAMNEQESYTLSRWIAENVREDEQGRYHYTVNSIEIKMDDE